MARTPTKTNNKAILDILAEVEGESGLKNRGILYQTIATRYNEMDFVKNGEFKTVSPTIVKWRLDDEQAPLKTPLGKRVKDKQSDILASVEESDKVEVTITEETPDGGVVDPPKSARKSRKKTPENNKDGINVVKIPRGDCPHSLASFDQDNVLSWAIKMREVAKRNNEYLTVGALQFYIRKIVIPDDNEKARAVCDILRENLTDEYS